MGKTGIEARIFDAALDILRRRGPLAVSMESVAAASGLAKTTLYRRFENREDLLDAAVSSVTDATAIPSDLSTPDLIRWVLSNASDTIERVVGRGTVGALVADADPAFTSRLRDMIRATTAPLREELRARSARGEIRSDLDVELIISLLLGGVVAELIRGRATDAAWVESVLTLIWPAFDKR